MIYDYARQLIGVFFLIAVVNLLVIPDSYKKIITFYMHFLIIVIILNPLIRIMDNEVGSFIDSITFVNEETFEESVRYYQGMIEDDLKEFTLAEVEQQIEEASRICGTEVTGIELKEMEILIIHMVETSESMENCMIVEVGISRENVRFERGGR